MAEIKIQDISINANGLLDDREDFIDDLSEDVLSGVIGGIANIQPANLDTYNIFVENEIVIEDVML